MTNNSQKQVFKGGWEELDNAIFTGNQGLVSTLPEAFHLKSDGTVIFTMVGTNVETHTISLPYYDPDKINTVSKTFSVAGEDTNPIGLCFNADETKMYVVGVFTKRLYQYNLPVAGDTDSIVDAPTSISLSIIASSPRQCQISRDGDFIFVTNGTSVYSFPLPVKGDITSFVPSTDTVFSPVGVSTYSIAFKPQGDKMYLGDPTTNIITEFDLSPVNIITSAVANGNTLPLNPDSLQPIDIAFRSNGKQLFIMDQLNNNITRYHFDADWNISTASHFTNSVAAADSQSIVWKPDGTKFFNLISSAGDRIDEFTMPNRWNQTGSTITANFSLIGIADIPRGIWVPPDGKTCIIVDNASNSLVRLNMSTGWSVNTMSDPGISLLLTSLVPGITNPTGVAFTKDQLTFYVTDSATDTVYQFTVPTPLDIVNAVYTGNSLPISGDTVDIRLKPDDRLMIIAERTGDNILLFRLPSDGNVANAGLLQTLPVGFLESNLQGFFIRENDGKKIWLVGTASGFIQSMDMSLEFNNSLITNFGEELITDAGENLVYA